MIVIERILNKLVRCILNCESQRLNSDRGLDQTDVTRRTSPLDERQAHCTDGGEVHEIANDVGLWILICLQSDEWFKVGCSSCIQGIFEYLVWHRNCSLSAVRREDGCNGNLSYIVWR